MQSEDAPIGHCKLIFDLRRSDRLLAGIADVSGSVTRKHAHRQLDGKVALCDLRANLFRSIRRKGHGALSIGELNRQAKEDAGAIYGRDDLYPSLTLSALGCPCSTAYTSVKRKDAEPTTAPAGPRGRAYASVTVWKAPVTLLAPTSG